MIKNNNTSAPSGAVGVHLIERSEKIFCRKWTLHSHKLKAVVFATYGAIIYGRPFSVNCYFVKLTGFPGIQVIVVYATVINDSCTSNCCAYNYHLVTT